MDEVKIRLKLVDDNAAEDIILVVVIPGGMTFDKLIEENIASAGWSDRNLIVKSARIYDKDFDEYADVMKPYSSLTLSNMQRFEVHLDKAEPKMGTILADISINGTVQRGQKLVLSSDSTVSDLIPVIASTFCKDATDTTVNSIKFFDSDFNEFIDVAKPYENVALNFQGRYAISIVYTKIPSNLNSNLHEMESKLSNQQVPSFVEMLDVSQKNIITNLWKADDLSISDKIGSIDSISKDMPKEARVEYRKWRFLMDRSKMPDFYDSQNNEIKMIIAATFKESTDLEEFAGTIMSIKPMLNNPDAFDKWMKNEEIEFKEPPIQEDMKSIESTKKRILVFGCSKAGKTSMLNTITGQKFKVSDAAVGTTFGTTIFEDFEYNGQIYQFIDTAGLDEGDKGTVASGFAIKNLTRFIKNEGKKGFNLFIMVMAKGVISQSIEKNYELFINYIKTKEIPTLCVVTRCENDKPPNKWIDENRTFFENKYKMEFNAMISSCFAQERNGRLADVYKELCNESKRDVMKMIEKTCSEKPYSIIQGGLLYTIKKIWNFFASATGLPRWLNGRLYDFLKAMGIDDGEAIGLAAEVDKKTNESQKPKQPQQK